jgi:hypothetical protein
VCWRLDTGWDGRHDASRPPTWRAIASAEQRKFDQVLADAPPAYRTAERIERLRACIVAGVTRKELSGEFGLSRQAPSITTSRSVNRDAHAVVNLDKTGWYEIGGRLEVTGDIRLLLAPRYSPELQPDQAGEQHLRNL